MAWRQHPFETQLHRQHVARERGLDGSARLSEGFAIEQTRHGEARLVSGAPPPARWIARLPGLEQPPAPARRRLLHNLVAHRLAFAPLRIWI
jgi:hypothetical protein